MTVTTYGDDASRVGNSEVFSNEFGLAARIAAMAAANPVVA